jgi:hypothetical protein
MSVRQIQAFRLAVVVRCSRRGERLKLPLSWPDVEAISPKRYEPEASTSVASSGS